MANKQNDNYFATALKKLVIDEDQFGTFARVPSQARKGCSYRVNIDESDPRNVHAVDCSCYRFSKVGKCKHITVTNSFYRRILHPQPVAVAKVTSIAERGTLNGTPDWVSILPSRQKQKVVA